MLKTLGRTQDGVDQLIDRTHDAVLAATDRAEQGVAATAERLASRAHATGDRIREKSETASRSAHERVAATAQAIDRGYSRTRSDLARAATTATDYVTAHPGKSLLMVASAGFLLGLLVRGRSTSA